jgi:hypothetical protein
VTAALISPLANLTGPTPTGYGYGLYSVAAPTDTADPRSGNGGQWPAVGCGVAQAFPIDCPPTVAPASLVSEDGLPWVSQFPFGVVAGVRCKPVGTTVAEMQTAARAILRLSEQHAVEKALWRGGVWPDAVTAEAGFLAQDPTILSATPVSPKAAVGLLEDGLVQLSGGVGVIHAPRLALGVIASDWPLRQSGGRLLTLLDTPVALGGGYDGSGPDGTRVAGQAWLYATGPVQITRGPVQDLPSDARLAVDRSTNDALIMATRTVSAGYACGVLGVPVTLA